MREELRYCVASLASPNTRNKVAILLRFAEHCMPEKSLADAFCDSASDVMLHLDGSREVRSRWPHSENRTSRDLAPGLLLARYRAT
jgi:hypothetical protein